ncbi:MAG: class I SAM-dependent methyltransferase [Nocardioides sp.]
MSLAGTRPSPNIWQHPATYETENRAFDPERLVEAAMRSVRDWADLVLLDLGCGSGFHLPRWAEAAARVYGVEPHLPLVSLAQRRTRRLSHVDVLRGTAQDIPLPDASVDVMHARWAYFFGPGCEPGLAELDRVMRRGGVGFVIDNDSSRSTFGRWFRRGYPKVPAADDVEKFWSLHGWQRQPVLTRWAFDSCADLEAVVRLELPPEAAEAALAEQATRGDSPLEIDYAVNVWWRRY